MARFRIVFAPGRRMGWLQRVAAFAVLAGVAVLAFFFLTVALVVGAVLALVVLARLWWLKRRLRQAPAAGTGTYEGEYVVIEHVEERAPRADPPPGRPPLP